MAIRIAFAGDTMLGRGVAERLREIPPERLFADEVVAATQDADLFLLNLECCISDRGRRWPAPGKPFFFRAPPNAVSALTHLGVDAVTLANNHALDFGHEALLDTIVLLQSAGVAVVGAGADITAARETVTLEAAGVRTALVGLADHPADFAATAASAGIAYAGLPAGLPSWVEEAVSRARGVADVVIVTPHWGPNMAPAPVPHVRAVATALLEASADLIAGHSAHVFQGVQFAPAGTVLYDLGDFIDDYAVDPELRNDLGLLWFVDIDEGSVQQVEALPLKLDYCYTHVATGDDAAWIHHRLDAACAPFGSTATKHDDHLVVAPRSGV